MDIPSGFTLFLALFVVYCTGACAFYVLSGAETKQRWYPRVVLAGAALFLVSVAVFWEPIALIGAVPPTAIVACMALKLPRFCLSCGQPLSRHSW